MANNLLGDLMSLMQNIRDNAQNLNKDIDTKDPREETQEDLSQLFTSFADLRNLLSNLEQSDVSKLQDELRKLMAGEETFADYRRDVAQTLMQVRQRMQSHAPTQQKIQDNLPQQAKTQNVDSLMENWHSILGNIQNWIEKNTKVDSRR